MDQVEKELTEQAEREVAFESDKIEVFKGRASKHFFAILSAFIDDSFFTDKERIYNVKGHNEYNKRATAQLQSDLKRLGLNYQKITGLWDGGYEKSFLVWNVAYSLPDFIKVMFQLSKYYKQKGICIGRGVGNDEYDVEVYKTESLDNIAYVNEKHYGKVSIADALKEYGTMLTRKVYDSKGKIDPDKVKRVIVFESLQENPCSAQDQYLVGCYERRDLIRDLMFGEFNKEERKAFEKFKREVFMVGEAQG